MSRCALTVEDGDRREHQAQYRLRMAIVVDAHVLLGEYRLLGLLDRAGHEHTKYHELGEGFHCVEHQLLERLRPEKYCEEEEGDEGGHDCLYHKSPSPRDQSSLRAPVF